MNAFPDWKKYAVHQKRENTGCIPTAYEILLRAAHTPNIDFATFQDEFDLDQHGGNPCNNFKSVAQAVQNKYPFVDFKEESFPKGQGHKKLARVEDFLTNQRPVIVSLSNEPEGRTGWHIMVVVDATNTDLILLEYVDQHGHHYTKL